MVADTKLVPFGTNSTSASCSVVSNSPPLEGGALFSNKDGAEAPHLMSRVLCVDHVGRKNDEGLTGFE